MIAKDLRIVYMGNPDFAVEPLRRLHSEGYNIVAIVTNPDKPSGRGQKLTSSPVKEYAVSNNLPILQPLRLKDEEFINQLRGLDIDLSIIVAFKMLPEVVWSMPKHGTFNLHTSLLPQYRGAAPINWAVINGDKYSGVTTFMLDKNIDTGEIIDSKRCDISDTDTAGELHDRLMMIGADLVIESVEKIAGENLILKPQTELEQGVTLLPAPKIFKADCEIDWNQDINSIYNKIRGLSPYPSAWCMLNDNLFKILEVSKEIVNHNKTFGEVVSNGKDFIKIPCSGGYINILQLQMSGKKKMNTIDFLRGFRLFD